MKGNQIRLDPDVLRHMELHAHAYERPTETLRRLLRLPDPVKQEKPKQAKAKA
jgi:hypothetical protein